MLNVIDKYMVKRIDAKHEPEKIGLFLASTALQVKLGTLNRNAPDDYTRNTKLQGDNFFGSPRMASLYLMKLALPAFQRFRWQIQQKAEQLNLKRLKKLHKKIDIKDVYELLGKMTELGTVKDEAFSKQLSTFQAQFAKIVSGDFREVAEFKQSQANLKKGLMTQRATLQSLADEEETETAREHYLHDITLIDKLIIGMEPISETAFIDPNFADRSDHLYRYYLDIAHHIETLKGVEESDFEHFVDRDIKQSILGIPDNITARLQKLVIPKDQSAILASFRGGTNQQIMSAELKKREDRLLRAMQALKQYNLQQYQPDKFEKLYSNYVSASNELKSYVRETVVPHFDRIQRGEEAHSTVSIKEPFYVLMTLEQIDKSVDYFFRCVNPIPGIHEAYQNYQDALHQFYFNLQQTDAYKSASKFDERTQQAYEQMYRVLEDAERKAKGDPQTQAEIQALKVRHLQDKLYLEGKLTAKHIRRDSETTLPEEVFDHGALWDNLESTEDKEAVESLLQDLSDCCPVAKLITDRLGQAFFNTPDHSVMSMLSFLPPYQPVRSNIDLNIQFNKEGQPNIQTTIVYDYLWDPIGKQILFADINGQKQIVNLDDIDEKYAMASEITIKDVEAFLKTQGERQPLATLKYNMDLAVVDMKHIEVRGLRAFELEVIDGIDICDDLPALVYWTPEFLDAAEEGIDFRALCDKAAIPLPPRGTLAVDREITVSDTMKEKGQDSISAEVKPKKMTKESIRSFKESERKGPFDRFSLGEEADEEELSDTDPDFKPPM